MQFSIHTVCNYAPTIYQFLEEVMLMQWMKESHWPSSLQNGHGMIQIFSKSDNGNLFSGTMCSQGHSIQYSDYRAPHLTATNFIVS